MTFFEGFYNWACLINFAFCLALPDMAVTDFDDLPIFVFYLFFNFI